MKAPRLAHRWLDRFAQKVLVIPVETVVHEHGRMAMLADDGDRLEPYVPFLSNFAAALALTLRASGIRPSSWRRPNAFARARRATASFSAG